jgi:hypothetical protein
VFKGLYDRHVRVFQISVLANKNNFNFVKEAFLPEQREMRSDGRGREMVVPFCYASPLRFQGQPFGNPLLRDVQTGKIEPLTEILNNSLRLQE